MENIVSRDTQADLDRLRVHFERLSDLATLRDYVERSTHWREGGADRHEALKVALPRLEASIRADANGATP